MQRNRAERPVPKGGWVMGGWWELWRFDVLQSGQAKTDGSWDDHHAKTHCYLFSHAQVVIVIVLLADPPGQEPRS